jgi:hypothetical protein
MESRLKTIELHEVSHLIDMRGVEDIQGEAFERFTELNAFYTELAFGSNPHDVMAQGLAGLLDELRQGRPVDYSIQKVATVLHFLKKCPVWGKTSPSGSLPTRCLELLATLKKSDFILAGKELYQPEFSRSSLFASTHP